MSDAADAGPVLESKDDSTRLMIEEVVGGEAEEKGVEGAPSSDAAGAGAGAGAGADGAAAGAAVESKTDAGAAAAPAAPAAGAGSGSATSGGSVYTFEAVKSFSPAYLNESELKDKAKQWNLDGFTCMRRFRFHQKFDIKQTDAFLGDFFSSPAVQAAFQVMGSSKQWTSLKGRARAVAKRRVPATVLTMEFWDRCLEDDIVTPTGYIRKCMEDVFDGVTVADELRRMFIDEDSEHVDLYEDAEKEEFMYRIMKAVATGGPLCQYDDLWDDYLKATKSIYKDLLTVYKDADTGDIRVSSLVFEVTGADTDVPLFPRENPHSFCFVVVDALKRQATVWYGGFIPFW